LEAARRGLEEECRLEGKQVLFDELKGGLAGDQDHPVYAELGARLGMTEGAVKVAVHRLRRRYGELLREQIAQTVAHGKDLEEEVQDLLAVFSD